MHWRNARQAIHDAFATNLTQPNPDEMGGTRFSSTGAICHQAEAGRVIKAVMDQTKYLRAMAIWNNAPDGCVEDREIVLLKTRLWSDYIRRVELTPWQQGEIVAVLDHIMLNFRARCQNPQRGNLYVGKDIQRLLGKSSEERFNVEQNRIMDLLQEYDQKSLQPVWQVVREERGDERADKKTT